MVPPSNVRVGHRPGSPRTIGAQSTTSGGRRPTTAVRTTVPSRVVSVERIGRHPLRRQRRAPAPSRPGPRSCCAGAGRPAHATASNRRPTLVVTGAFSAVGEQPATSSARSRAAERRAVDASRSARTPAPAIASEQRRALHAAAPLTARSPPGSRNGRSAGRAREASVRQRRQELAAPDGAVLPVAGAVPGHAQHRPVELVLRHARRDVRVVVLHPAQTGRPQRVARVRASRDSPGGDPSRPRRADGDTALEARRSRR